MRGTTIEAPNTARAWAIELAACLAVGLLLGVIGPFGSFFNDTLPVRMVYWVCVFLTCGLVFGAAIRWSAPRARSAGVPVWAWAPVVVLIASAPLGGLGRLFAAAFWPGILDAVGLIEWYGQTVLLGLIYVGAYAVVRLRATSAPDARGAATTGPTILRRLPPRLGRDLLCLQMEDHYVRLHTPKGSTLMLMSLSQAMAEVDGVEGLQVHRSWWVARHAVQRVVQDGRSLRLLLTNEMEAPVSRAHVARLRSAGWLDAEQATSGR